MYECYYTYREVSTLASFPDARISIWRTHFELRMREWVETLNGSNRWAIDAKSATVIELVSVLDETTLPVGWGWGWPDLGNPFHCDTSIILYAILLLRIHLSTWGICLNFAEDQQTRCHQVILATPNNLPSTELSKISHKLGFWVHICTHTKHTGNHLDITLAVLIMNVEAGGKEQDSQASFMSSYPS